MTVSTVTTTQNGVHQGRGVREQLEAIDAAVRAIATGWLAGEFDEQSARRKIASIAAVIEVHGTWVPNGDRGDEVRSETRLEMMRRIQPEPGSKIQSSKLDLKMVAAGTSFTGWYLNLQGFIGRMVARTNRQRNAVNRPVSTGLGDLDAGPMALHAAEDLGDMRTSIAARSVKDHVPRRGSAFETPLTAALVAKIWDLPDRNYGPASDNRFLGPAGAAAARTLWRDSGIPPLVAARWSPADVEWFLSHDTRLVAVILDAATSARQRKVVSPEARRDLAELLAYEIPDRVIAAYMNWVALPGVDPNEFVRVLDAWADKADRYPEVVKADLDSAFDRFERSAAMARPHRSTAD